MPNLTFGKRISIASGIALFALGTVNMVSPTQAASLNLNYTVENLTDGWFNYSFQLKVDNTDNSYVPGQAWRWIVFGDTDSWDQVSLLTKINFEGRLTDWVGDLSKSSSWIGIFTGSGGGHNGITLGSFSRTDLTSHPVLTWWTPSDVNDYLYWSGKSTAKLQQGELLFSTLAGTLNGATPANFKVANRVDSFNGATAPDEDFPDVDVPEPLTVFSSILGLGVLGVVKRKRQQQ